MLRIRSYFTEALSRNLKTNRLEQTLDLGLSAHADSHPLRQAIPIDGSDDEAMLFQPARQRCGLSYALVVAPDT